MSTATYGSMLWTFQGANAAEAIVIPGNSIAVDVSSARRWIDCESELKAIRRYRKDWDGMDAEAPDPKLVDNAILFLGKLRRDGHLPAPDAISASPSGTIVFAWTSMPGYAEAEIVSEGVVEWMVESTSETIHTKQEWSDIDQRRAVRQGDRWGQIHSTSCEESEQFSNSR